MQYRAADPVRLRQPSTDIGRCQPFYRESAFMQENHGVLGLEVRDVLRRAAIAQDQVTARREPSKPQALWQWLLAGRWAVLDAFSTSTIQYVIVCGNPEDGGALQALTDRECAVLEFAASGRSGKWIALELRLSESTVARTLHTALRHLGVADTAVLIGIRNALFEPLEGVTLGMDLAMARLTPVPPSAAALSDAERAVVAAWLGGKPAAAIARDRGTSVRTVSNQIASVYRKLGVSSRREALVVLT
jgi:DNA-binding NarL/FixJ family response regulator